MRNLLLLLFFISCNPVKQVLKNQDKFNEVAKEVISRGYCINDTTYITKSDTLIKVDTLVEIQKDLEVVTLNDTTYVTKWKTKTITKTLTIRDTIKLNIVDNARVRLLQTDSARLNDEVITWKGKAQRRQIWVFGLIALIFGALYIKSKL
jgi:hypothetical protein